MKQLIQHLGLDERDDLDCAWHTELPDLTISFGDHGAVVLTPRQYLSRVEDWNKGTRCVLPFSSMYFNDGEEHETDWIILGTPLLQSLYSVFDIDNEIISCECLTQLIFAILSGDALRSLANLFQWLFGRTDVKGKAQITFG
jgi:saccharopepsin